MATFTIRPDNGCTYKTEPSVTRVKFGDGYEQRQAIGLNTMPRTWALRFSVRTDTEVNAIISFLETHGGVLTFDWTDPYGVTGKFVCRSWSVTKDRFNLNTVVADFEQVYEP